MPIVASGYPLTDELNAECERIQKALEQSQKDVERLSREAPTANSVFKDKFNIRLIQLLDEPKFKTDKLREAKAHIDCAKEYLDYKLKESLLEAAKSAVYVYKALLNAWQTKCGNLKAEKEVSNVGAPGPHSGWKHTEF